MILVNDQGWTWLDAGAAGGLSCVGDDISIGCEASQKRSSKTLIIETGK